MTTNLDTHYIETNVSCLLNEYGVFNGYTRVVELANKLELQVISATFNDSNISGMLILNNSERNIYVDATNPVVRQRFTIAHEIGHYVLHNNIIEQQEGNVFYRDQEHSTNHLEQEANRFAAALLLPADKVKQDWENIGNIVIIASRYKVSVDTAKYRLKALGLGNF